MKVTIEKWLPKNLRGFCGRWWRFSTQKSSIPKRPLQGWIKMIQINHSRVFWVADYDYKLTFLVSLLRAPKNHWTRGRGQDSLDPKYGLNWLFSTKGKGVEEFWSRKRDQPIDQPKPILVYNFRVECFFMAAQENGPITGQFVLNYYYYFELYQISISVIVLNFEL